MYKMKKSRCARALICLLVLFSLLTIWGFAEESATTEAPAPEAAAQSEFMPNEVVDWDAVNAAVEEASQADTDPEINVLDGLKSILNSTGLAQGEWRQYAMILVACVLLYLAIVKQFEPLLLLPIAFGMLLANLPAAGMMSHPQYTFYGTLQEAVVAAERLGRDLSEVVWRFNEATGTMQYSLQTANGGMLYYIYHGVKLGIFPPIIFMGVGAMTDFAPLIANPKSLLLGAAAQLGIFLTFIGAKALGFSAAEAGSIGIIGGADGPTAIFVTTKLAPHLLGAIAVAAYSYMALVPVIQPPIMKLLTTKKERAIRMGQLREVSKTELVIFPIAVTIIVSLLLPDAASLVGMLMLGNLLRVSGVVERLNKTAQNELCNIVTIFLGLTVGATTEGTTFLTPDTLYILIWHRGRRAAGQADEQAVPHAGQSADRLRRRLRRADGGARFAEGRPGGRSGQLPADARHGPERVGRHRLRGCGGRVHRAVRLILKELTARPASIRAAGRASMQIAA